jgi:hypothetical protein
MIFSVQNSSHVYNNQPSPKTFTQSFCASLEGTLLCLTVTFMAKQVKAPGKGK